MFDLLLLRLPCFLLWILWFSGYLSVAFMVETYVLNVFCFVYCWIIAG